MRRREFLFELRCAVCETQVKIRSDSGRHHCSTHRTEEHAGAENLRSCMIGNGFNRVNLNAPNATLTSPSFGRILGAGPARVVQFGLKYQF